MLHTSFGGNTVGSSGIGPPHNRAYVSSIGSPGGGSNSLKVKYPEGQLGVADSGVNFRVPVVPVSEATLSYDVMFKDGFDFSAAGGKLPGLTGNRAEATSNNHPMNIEGGAWSSRVQWGVDGKMEQYTYHLGYVDEYGDPIEYGHGMPWIWPSGGNQVKFATNQWYRITMNVAMNTPGVADGKLKVTLQRLGGSNPMSSAATVLNRDEMLWRDEGQESLRVENLYFSSFFGGSTPDYLPAHDSYIYFDTFRLVEGGSQNLQSLPEPATAAMFSIAAALLWRRPNGSRTCHACKSDNATKL